MEGGTLTLTGRLAEYVTGARPAEQDPRLREAALVAVTDGIACMVGGTREDLGRILHRYADDLSTATGGSSVLCSPLRTSPSAAAYVNAAAGHALCYDDTSNAMMGHPTIVVLPAALAVGEYAGSTGAELLDAYAVGVEVAVRVSARLAPGHYQRGWHATGVSGVVGAAAAACRLLGLDTAATARALNIAASSAQGLRANFGSMTMIYHAGLASRGGVDAAFLAARGMTTAADPFSGPIGYFTMFEGNGTAGELPPLELDGPLELVDPGLDVKPYPCGSLAHRAIQGVIELRAEHQLDPAEVERIVCRIPQLHQDVLVNVAPRDVLESRISLVYPVSVAMLRGSCNLDDFGTGLLASPQVQDLMSRVRVERLDVSTATAAELFAAPAEVVLQMRDGRSFRTLVRDVKGSPSNPLTPSEWDAKFDECTVPSLGADVSRQLRKQLRELHLLPDVRTLAALLTTPGQA